MIMQSAPDEDEKMEAEAHRFAASFLMPASKIRPYLNGPRLNGLGRVKAYWKVSIKALIRRSYDLSLITPSQYKYPNIQYNSTFKESEPFPVDVETPTRLAQIVAYHREALGYSTQDLADLLAFTIEDVEQFYERPRSGVRFVVSN